jgi:predicted nucleotidyltransferase
MVQWLPFVRMVAVTGALAKDNVGQRVDIDLLIVAAPGRIWVCRRFLILAVRVARLLGDELRHVGYTAMLIEKLTADLDPDRLVRLFCKRFSEFNALTVDQLGEGIFD